MAPSYQVSRDQNDASRKAHQGQRLFYGRQRHCPGIENSHLHRYEKVIREKQSSGTERWPLVWNLLLRTTIRIQQLRGLNGTKLMRRSPKQSMGLRRDQPSFLTACHFSWKLCDLVLHLVLVGRVCLKRGTNPWEENGSDEWGCQTYHEANEVRGTRSGAGKTDRQGILTNVQLQGDVDLRKSDGRCGTQ